MPFFYDPPSPPTARSSAQPVAALLARCLAGGDPDAWCRLARCTQRRVRTIIVRILETSGTRAVVDDVDDLTQEFFCRLIVMRDGLPEPERGLRGRSDGEAWSYMTRVARAAVIDFLRARHAAKRPPPEAGCSSTRLLRSLPAIQATPEEQMLTIERVDGLVARCHHGFGGQPDCTRTQAVKRAVVDGWTSAEIVDASAGAMTRQQVDTWVCRTRRRLAADGVVLARRGVA